MMIEQKFKHIDPQAQEEAKSILALFRFYNLDGLLYLSNNEQAIRDLFDAVILAIESATILKPYVPYNEFVLPSREVLEGDPGWVGHFDELDNRKFFLSDVYDFLQLYFNRRAS